jgi:hypothetical protein
MDRSLKINWAVRWNSGRVILHTPRWSFSVRSPADHACYSERYRVKTKVIPLGSGWRFVIRTRD